jgi:hypothetical protein
MIGIALRLTLFILAWGSVGWGAGPLEIGLANPGFERDLGDDWERASEAGGILVRDPTVAHTGGGSARAERTVGWAGFFTGGGHLIAVQPGEQFKLAAFLRLQEATGQTSLSLDGYRAGQYVRTLAQSPPRSGTTEGWIYTYVLATVPADGSVTHLRAGLRSENNQGVAWFDDVRLWRLPPDVPEDSGPPGPPPQGQITVADGHLVGADGRRVRLWGVNVYEETLRTYREQSHIARRIREMGFNAVRVWWHDEVIVDTEARTPAGETTSLVFRQSTRGDGSPLDRMDHFIYRAECEGLYLYMSLDRMTRGVFGPGDYDVLPSAGPEDEKAWKAAVAELQPPGRITDESVYYVDPRLGEAHARYVAHVVSRKNPYTGRTYAEDPYVVLWEETNENSTTELLLTGGFRKWPAYFQKVMQKRWNDWLKAKYADDEGVLAAWGTLNEGESLPAASVACAPVLSEAAQYPAKRLEDFSEFVYDLLIGYSQRLRSIIQAAGSCAARTPVGFNTLYEHKHRVYYPATWGDVVLVGTYGMGGGATFDRETRRIHPGFVEFYNLSYATVQGKPMVVYEINTLKPDVWRADYPLWVSAFASLRDWDGVFWYTWSDGTVPDQFDNDAYVYTGLRYAAVGHYWHGIVISTDEVLLASLRLAGHLFTGFAIPAAPDPVTITIGRRDLFGPKLWIGDIDVPFPPEAPGPYRRAYALSITDMVRTCRFVYDPRVESSSLSSPLLARLPQPCSPVAGVTYDFDRGTLKVDQPGGRAIVGFVGEGETFSDGISLRVTSPHDPDFLCFGLASTDGRPLAEARTATLVLTTYGENPGRTLWEDPSKVPGDVPGFAKLVKGWGWGPVQIARPGAHIELGRRWRWRIRDFALEVLEEGEGSVLEIAPGTPVYCVDLWHD